MKKNAVKINFCIIFYYFSNYKMESSISRNRIKKLEFPEIPDRYHFATKKNTWEASNLTVKDRKNSQKQSILKNYFLSIESLINSPVGNKTPNPRPMKYKSKYSKSRLNELDLELDSREIFYQESGDFDLAIIETIFFAYISYFEGIIECISVDKNIYKSHLNRAKFGLINVFKKLFPKLEKMVSVSADKQNQTLMTINPTKSSVILSKLGDIVNQELANTDNLEKIIKKTLIDSTRKKKITNSGTQSDYKMNSDGIIEYEFKSYEALQTELLALKLQNSILLEEKKISVRDVEELDDIDKLINRNKILEDMIIEMRNSQTN